MENCECSIIAGCVVYSYTVEGPTKRSDSAMPVSRETAPTSRREAKAAKAPSHIATAKNAAARKEVSLKKIFLALLFVLLSPFALLIDIFAAGMRLVCQRLYGFVRTRTAAAGVLGTASCLLLVTSLLTLL